MAMNPIWQTQVMMESICCIWKTRVFSNVCRIQKKLIKLMKKVIIDSPTSQKVKIRISSLIVTTLDWGEVLGVSKADIINFRKLTFDWLVQYLLRRREIESIYREAWRRGTSLLPNRACVTLGFLMIVCTCNLFFDSFSLMHAPFYYCTTVPARKKKNH